MKIIILLTALFFCFTTNAQNTKIAGENFLALNKNKTGVITTPSGLQYLVLLKGSGAIPKATDAVKVNYECKLIDGTMVDASANHGAAMQFNVSEVMPGWQEALQLMPNGSKYRLFIPSALAYGDRASGDKIKAGETLIFDLEIVALNGIAAPAIVATKTVPANVPQPVATINAPALLTYLGEDAIEKKIDGYASGKKTAGLVALNGKYYFATPNGNFYQTEGSEPTTKIIDKFLPQDFMFLAATNKNVYYGKDATGGIIKYLFRYNPSTTKTDNVVYENSERFYLNSADVPGQSQTADAFFVSRDKTTILTRKFSKDYFHIHRLSESNEAPVLNNVYSSKLDMAYVTTPISVNTEVNLFDNEIYFNGRVRPTGVYETSTTIYKPADANKNEFEFKTNFYLLKKGITIYDRFLQTNKAIYSLLKVKDSSTGDSYHNLFYYNGNNLSGTLNTFPSKATDFDAQVLDNSVYVSYTGEIWKLDEDKNEFTNVFINKTNPESWDYIQKNKRFLKAGNYLLYSKGKKYTSFNIITKKSIDLKDPALANQPNFFSYHKTYFYAGVNSFYFMDKVDGKEVFTQYNPGNNSYTPFVFPEFKKQSFAEIKAICQADNKFVFLTSYMDKKNKPVYKMFMYTEAVNTIDPVTAPTAPVRPVTKTFDSKLFEQQINSIIADPGNRFKNIIGEIKTNTTYSAAVNASTVAVEGIGDGIITNYVESRTLMYTAESKRMFKEEAAAIMEIIEKQLQKIKLPFSFSKKVNYDVASRRLISYEFNGKMATIDLDMLRGGDTPDAPNWTVTFRVRK